MEIHNVKGITSIISGHTHRGAFENLSLTERRYLESKVKTNSAKIRHQAAVTIPMKIWRRLCGGSPDSMPGRPFVRDPRGWRAAACN